MNVKDKITSRTEDVRTEMHRAWESIGLCKTADALSDLTNKIAELEGRLALLYTIERCWQHKQDAARLLAWLAGDIARGADDKWSGRTNDVKRSNFDGRCDEARRWISACEFILGAD
jgi:hypothetical protein